MGEAAEDAAYDPDDIEGAIDDDPSSLINAKGKKENAEKQPPSSGGGPTTSSAGPADVLKEIVHWRPALKLFCIYAMHEFAYLPEARERLQFAISDHPKIFRLCWWLDLTIMLTAVGILLYGAYRYFAR